VASQSLGTSPHGLIWSSVADSTILVSRERGATRRGVRNAAEALTAAGATIIGVVEVKAQGVRRGGLIGWGAQTASTITSPLRRSR
jgi:Mrp family chromosome partitioning ATPase